MRSLSASARNLATRIALAIIITASAGITANASVTANANVIVNANVTLSLSKGAPASSPTPAPAQTTIPVLPFPYTPQTPVPFRLDRSHIGIVPGTTERAHISGNARRPIKITSSFAGVNASYDAPSRTLSLKGITRGSGTVTLTDAAGAKATAAVLVAPPAGTVAPDVNVELAGDVTPSFVAAKVREAIAQRSVLQPFVDVRIPFSSLPLNGPQSYTLPIDVELDGKGTFVNVKATSSVHLRFSPPAPPVPPAAPLTLFYSDSPEVRHCGRRALPLGHAGDRGPPGAHLSVPRRDDGCAHVCARSPRARRRGARRAHRRRGAAVNQIPLHGPPRDGGLLARTAPPRERRRDGRTGSRRSCCRCKATCTSGI